MADVSRKTRVIGVGMRHRIRNVCAWVGVVLFGSVVLPYGITKGNKYVGGRDGFLALCVVCGASFVVWLIATDAVWLRIRRGRPDDELSAVFEPAPRPGYLQVGITNNGLSLRDAGLNLLAPARIGRLRRVASNLESVTDGTEAPTSEELEPGEPSTYWSEVGLRVPGGGQTSLFYFFVGHRAGTYPLRLKLYDDSGEPRRLHVDGTFTIPSGINEEGRQRLLESIQDELAWNRARLREALGTGELCLGESLIPFSTRHSGLANRIATQGRDAAVATKIEEAYNELGRVGSGFHATSRGLEVRHENGVQMHWIRVWPEDRIEKAMAYVIDAMLATEAALAPEEVLSA